MAEQRQPWEWRKPGGGCSGESDRGLPVAEWHFHAYDVNDNAACRVSIGLIASVEPPNEGSKLCPDCIAVVKAQPEGREKRVYTHA